MTLTELCKKAGQTLDQYLESNLDNPGDPYLLADEKEAVLRYLAPKPIGRVERYELTRRERTKRC